MVAALAATICIDAGWQCALMAPTEILAEQHPQSCSIGWSLWRDHRVVDGYAKTQARREALAMVESGEAQLVVGTPQ